MTLTQAGARLGVSASMVSILLATNPQLGRKIGRSWYLNRREVDRLKKERAADA